MQQQQTAFENIVGKEEIARNEQFLPFPQCFLLNQKILSSFVNIFDIISLFDAELEEPKIGISGKGLIPYQPFNGNREAGSCIILKTFFLQGYKMAFAFAIANIVGNGGKCWSLALSTFSAVFSKPIFLRVWQNSQLFGKRFTQGQ